MKLRRDYDFLNMLRAQTFSMYKPGVRLGEMIDLWQYIVKINLSEGRKVI